MKGTLPVAIVFSAHHQQVDDFHFSVFCTVIMRNALI